MLKESSSPYINQFLSADTIVPEYDNPHSLNRYSYVLNNPLRYTDPTGHRYVEDGFEGSLRSVEDKMTKKWKAKLEKRREKKINQRGSVEIEIPSYIPASYNPHAHEPLVYSSQCPGYCHREQEYESVGLNLGISSFLNASQQAYQDGVWDFSSSTQGTPAYVPVTILEVAANLIGGLANLVSNSNGPSINTNPVTPTSSPTRPTGTPPLTATGVTPTGTWTPSLTATPTLSITPSATLSSPLTSTLTVTTTTTPVYRVP